MTYRLKSAPNSSNPIIWDFLSKNYLFIRTCTNILTLIFNVVLDKKKIKTNHIP